MINATLQQLNVFKEIALAGGIKQAATKLNIAPASVSQSLKTLEQQLGIPLFIRSTRKIELTPAGQLLLEQIISPMANLQAALESVHDLSHQPSGKVRITMPRFVYQHLIKPYVTEFCQRYPAIELELSISDAVVNLVTDGFDLGIRFGEKLDENMVAYPITPKMKDALFTSPVYIAENGLPKSPVDLMQHKLIYYRFISANKITPPKLYIEQQAVEVNMPCALIVNDTDAIIDSALAGLGIGRFIQLGVQKYLDSGELVPILEDYWLPLSPLHLYFVKNSQKAKRIRVLIDYLKEKLTPN